MRCIVPHQRVAARVDQGYAECGGACHVYIRYDGAVDAPEDRSGDARLLCYVGYGDPVGIGRVYPVRIAVYVAAVHRYICGVDYAYAVALGGGRGLYP